MDTACAFGGCPRQGAVRARFSRKCGHGNHYMNPGGPVIRLICTGHAEAKAGEIAPATPCATCGEVNGVICTPLLMGEPWESFNKILPH